MLRPGSVGLRRLRHRKYSGSTQRAHQKKASLNVSNPSGLVYTDLMGLISPAALGGFEYVSKITDEYTKWTEGFLIQTKRGAEDTIQLYVKSLWHPWDIS